jgi:hypothetical protein
MPRADPPRRARPLLRVGQALIGLTVGLAIAEGAFHARDHGAFPHLNVYVADAERGVRLAPGATERLAYGDNPVTSIRINAAGLRGAELGPPADGEVVVVGDSQVFGLGVQEDETTPAQLGKALGRAVVNAGVPTYGPPEYAALLDEMLAARRPKLVVYVVNFANDLFEANRPNTERHAVWDGWAVRKETAPSHVATFPGRALLYGKSHLVYALRQAWYARRVTFDDRAFASEGSWEDLRARGHAVEEARAHADAETGRLGELWGVEIAYLESGSRIARQRVASILTESTSLGEGDRLAFDAGGASPGDILSIGCGEECVRAVPATAELIRRGALLREQLEAAIRKRAEAAASAERTEKLARLDRSKEEQARLDQRLAALRAAPAAIARAEGPMAAPLRKVKALCDAHGAELLVVALPLDVQVDPGEWQKYGAAPVDLGPARVLVADVVQTAEALGAKGLDATAALAAAQPGAFLRGDIHLSPRGHHALAEAIAARLAEKPLPPAPRGELPPHRSRAPTEHDFTQAGEIVVKGSSAAGCETKMIREWLRVLCRKGTPTAVTIERGGHGEAVALATGGVGTLLIPILYGDDVAVDFSWEDRTQRLVVRARADASDLDLRFEAKGPPRAPAAPPPGLDKVCACYQKVRGLATCGGFAAFLDDACLAAYADDCERLVACVSGDAFRAPSCPRGQANAGVTGHCKKLCGPDLPCTSGACTEWSGGHVCM